MDNKVELIAWWNGDKDNILLSCNTAEIVDEGWKLVKVIIEPIPEKTDQEKAINRLNSTTKKLDKSVRNLVKTTRNWKKF